MGCYFPLKILFRFAVLCSFIILGIHSQNAENSLTPAEIEILLKPLLALPGQRTLQAQALRQQLINLIEEGLDEVGPDEYDDDAPIKRNLQSLARGGYLKSVGDDAQENDLIGAKRGISSLARNGELHHHKREQLEELLDELNEKRNIGSLARDYNFPSYGKRFIGSLARNNDLSRYEPGKRNLASIMRNGKRNIASLVRNNNLPIALDEYKRNIASLARDGEKLVGKRNVAALLRQDNYLNQKMQPDDLNESYQTEKPDEHHDNHNQEQIEEAPKRNLASVKATYKQKYKRSVSLRNKRQADYFEDQNAEYPQPVYQKQNAMDYDEFVRALAELYPPAEKRFLGSVARSGWPSSLVKYRGADKRHIASLARLGWLPSFRSVRRFNRSGRSTNYDECGVCRETPANGQTQDNTYAKSYEKENKRFLLIPAVDKVLYRRFPTGPRNIQ